jgi:hypothetical protein
LLAFRVLRFEFGSFFRDLFVALTLGLLGLLEAFEAGLQLAGLRGERRMIFAGRVFMSERFIPSCFAAGDMLLEGGQRALTAQNGLVESGEEAALLGVVLTRGGVLCLEGG